MIGTLSGGCDLTAVADIVDAARGRLGAIAHDLDAVLISSAAAVDETRWQSRAAAAFHRRAARLDEDIAALLRAVDVFHDELIGVRRSIDIAIEAQCGR